MMRVLVLIMLVFPALMKAQGVTGTWKDFAIGTPALHMSLPGIPEAQAPKLPQEVLKFIRNYSSSYLKSDDLVVTIMFAEYLPEIISDAKGAIEGTKNQWEKTGAKVSVGTTEDIKVSGRRAVRQQGKLIQGNEEHDYVDIVVVEANKLWQLIIMSKSKDAELTSMSRKISSSLSF